MTSATDPDHQNTLLLGQIKGIVEGLRDGQLHQQQSLTALSTRIDTRMDGIDNRLRSVEQRSAAYGAVSGGVMGIGMALLVEGLKAWVKRGPGL